MQDKERQIKHAKRSTLLGKLEKLVVASPDDFHARVLAVDKAMDLVLDYLGDHDITIALHEVQGRP